MRKPIVLFIMLNLLLATALTAQPAEYDMIFQAIQPPDQLISAEFSTRNRITTFMVTLVSKSDPIALTEKLHKETGLDLLYVEYTPQKSTYRIELSKEGVGRVDMTEFDRLLAQEWQNTGESDLTIKVDPFEISVTVSTSDPAHLSNNLEIATECQLEFTGTIPHKNSSAAIFSRQLQGRLKLPATSEISEEELPEIVRHFREEYGLATAKTSGDDIEIRFYADLKQITQCLAVPAQFEKNVNFFSVLVSENEKPEICLRVTDNKINNSRKLELLRTLTNTEKFFWLNHSPSNEAPVLTAIETDFGRGFTIKGITHKSRLVFSQLFPMLEQLDSIHSPFFTQGTYSDTPQGRMMNFTAVCAW